MENYNTFAETEALLQTMIRYSGQMLIILITIQTLALRIVLKIISILHILATLTTINWRVALGTVMTVPWAQRM